MREALLIILLSVIYVQDVNSTCSRIPQGASGVRSPVDDNFKILIDGNPTTYIPDHQYNVSLSCPISMKFISFTLVVESEDESGAFSGQDTTGHFELFSNAETRFNTGCENMVESTNTNVKSRIDVSWIAPKPDSGCVLIKAGVLQHRDVWFIDDGYLTKRICAEEIDELNSLTSPLQTCCACDEAKYEIVIERRWTKNTHAKDFPLESWRTRIGEIIGASHSYNYRYWAYGGRASQGMRELAEHGATRTLEQEIRENTQTGDVRTIIKAPGIGYRKNVYGTTLANARVDPQHHQISLAAKIDPSPDWILGVAGLELCLSNCTWLEHKVLNLYPWDIGSDSGPSYMSADQPQVPPDVIRRITSSYPSDYRSPFFDDSGAPMKPLATLYLTKKKLYIRECEEVPQEGPLECATHPWNDWSNCSTRCGPGYSQRIRSYKNPTLAASYSCDRTLNEIIQCQGTQCGMDEPTNGELDGSAPIAECELTNWSNWSPCSKTCGRGTSTRTRDYHNSRAKARCQAVVRLPLEETRQCIGSDCGGTIPDNGEFDGLPDPDMFGGANAGPYDNNRPTWGSPRDNNRFESDYSGTERNSQSWNINSNQNRFASPASGDTQSGYDSNQRQPVDVERTKPNSYYKEQLQGNPVNSYNDYRQDTTTNNYNDYRQDGRANNYNVYGQNTNRANNYNDYNQQGANQNTEYTTPYSRFGISTRAPYGRYPDGQQDNTVNGFNVIQEYCYQKPLASTQPCLANPVIQSNFWFYDNDDHQCKIFTTDNCDENSNRFRTLMACEGTCLQPLIDLARAGPTDDNANDGGNMQLNRVFGEEFGTPMSQTTNKFNNNFRRGRYGS